MPAPAPRQEEPAYDDEEDEVSLSNRGHVCARPAVLKPGAALASAPERLQARRGAIGPDGAGQRGGEGIQQDPSSRGFRAAWSSGGGGAQDDEFRDFIVEDEPGPDGAPVQQRRRIRRTGLPAGVSGAALRVCRAIFQFICADMHRRSSC